MNQPPAANPPEIPAASAPTPGRSPLPGLVPALALVALVAGAYAASLRGGFVWDDLILVKKNPLATGELNLLNVWVHTDFALSTVVSYFEWLLFKDSAPGYRVVNLLLHASSAVLFWRWLRQMEFRGAWRAAAIFALHPMAVASVAWISELKNTLALPFLLLSGLWFLKGATGPAARRYQMASVAAFTLALLAKTSTVVLPPLLLALLWWRNGTLTRRDWERVAPHFGLALIFGALTVYFQTQQAIRGVTVQTETWLGRWAEAGTAVWFYLGKMLWPLNLCAIYPGWADWFSPATKFVPLLALLAGFAVAWKYRHGLGRPIGFALGAFILALFPVLGLADMYFMIFSRVSDHLAYVALLVFSATAGGVIARLRPAPASAVTAGVLLAGLGFLTWQRAQVYAQDETLWQDTVTRNPRAWNAHNNLACNFAERGDLDRAMKHFTAALELNPQNAAAHRNLGKALLIRGNFAGAEPHFRAALELSPRDTETMSTYASGLAQAQRFREGAEWLQRAEAIKPALEQKRQLVPLLLRTGNYGPALATSREIVALDPNSVADLNNIAWLLATCPEASFRNGPEAVKFSEQACRLTNYRQPMFLGTLAAGLAESGDFTNAVAVTQSAIELASAAGNEPFVAMNRQLLKLYQARQPFHLPAPKTGPAR